MPGSAAFSFPSRSSRTATWARQAADLLEGDSQALSSLMTTEMGKTRTAAELEISKCAAGLRYYSEHAEAMLADVPADAAAVKATAARVIWQPLGVVLAVMPWNFPLWQAMRFAAPALMAGNVGRASDAARLALESPQGRVMLQKSLAATGEFLAGRLMPVKAPKAPKP